ncbi:hypothetical protein K505DRAFT_148707 [Melanomma pulvis-pyrius CBS 109.77]|uniref:Uncharacterized protein n=1 Tax=Melanomma pulvis-pyrius CBS 109.77 TaxID=1314802 RepID=A0A6A6XM30_9PLEO|nr:hypothetical protein K505DRAFT_148707 [Melanomma pulvis-pyrius CBS 109.77]
MHASQSAQAGLSRHKSTNKGMLCSIRVAALQPTTGHTTPSPRVPRNYQAPADCSTNAWPMGWGGSGFGRSCMGARVRACMRACVRRCRGRRSGWDGGMEGWLGHGKPIRWRQTRVGGRGNGGERAGPWSDGCGKPAVSTVEVVYEGIRRTRCRLHREGCRVWDRLGGGGYPAWGCGMNSGQGQGD